MWAAGGPLDRGAAAGGNRPDQRHSHPGDQVAEGRRADTSVPRKAAMALAARLPKLCSAASSPNPDSRSPTEARADESRVAVCAQPDGTMGSLLPRVTSTGTLTWGSLSSIGSRRAWARVPATRCGPASRTSQTRIDSCKGSSLTVSHNHLRICRARCGPTGPWLGRSRPGRRPGRDGARPARRRPGSRRSCPAPPPVAVRQLPATRPGDRHARRRPGPAQGRH
jgi:hypothetical protein